MVIIILLKILQTYLTVQKQKLQVSALEIELNVAQLETLRWQLNPHFLFNTLKWGHYFDDYWYSLKSNIVEFTIHIFIVYGHIFYLIPKFIYKKKMVC